MTHILIVSSPYYPEIAGALEAGAKAALKEAGATFEVVEVPGALEIPPAIALATKHDKYDAFIALGCVIRGETSHYDIVAGESARALMDLSVSQHVLIGNGILTVENKAQALVRADVDQGNKGGVAAEATLKMLTLKKQWGAHGASK